MSVMCTPALAHGLCTAADLARQPLLGSYRTDEWTACFDAAGATCPVVRGAADVTQRRHATEAPKAASTSTSAVLAGG